MRVLDVGCGVGGPAREIARFSDAKITGLNNNDFQIGRARRYTKAAGLEDQVQFVKGDFMKLSEQFGENVFDAGARFPCMSINRVDIRTLVAIQYTLLRLQFTPQHGKAFTAKY
jgi:SAM-dependent methyltransferase